jgi:hypothetical protein
MPFLLLRYLRWLAALLLLASLVLPWFHVPVGVRQVAPETFEAIIREPITTPVFKWIVISAIGMAVAVSRVRQAGHRLDRAAPLAVCGIVLCLLLLVLFPALTTQRCPGITAHAAWLQAQHDNLTFLGGDAYNAQEYNFLPGQLQTNINELPNFFVAIPNPPQSLGEFSLAKLPDIIMWLGFTPAFCQFASSGWFCGLFGSALLMLSFLREERVGWQPPQRVAVLILTAPALGVICLAPVAVAGYALAAARDQAALGDYRGALVELGRAEFWLPVLAYETDVIYQRGWLEAKCGRDTPAARFVDARRKESQNFGEVAEREYEKLLAPDTPHPVRSEAFRGLLRLAIEDFNSGLTDRACERFSNLAAADPSSLTVLYGLQMADLRRDRLAALRRDLAQFTAVYRVFQSPEVGAILSLGHHHVAELAFDHHDPAMVDEQSPLLTAPLEKR